MARKTKEESQRTRERILDAAEQVFARRGVGSATIAHIADTAGMSRGAVYGHYRNKVDICLAMCRRAYRRGALTRENFDKASTVEGLLHSSLYILRQWLMPGSLQRSVDVLYFKCEYRKEHATLLRFRSLQERIFRRSLVRLFRAGIARGDFPEDMNMDMVVAYTHVTLAGIYHIHQRYGAHADFWNYVEVIVRIGIDGLRRSWHLRQIMESTHSPPPTPEEAFRHGAAHHSQ